jgi:hypothetical protein
VTRDVEAYEIETKNGFDNFNTQEIKRLYAKNGYLYYIKNRIHIFDAKETGKYADGNKYGNLAFKIRKTDNDNNIKEVSEKISNMGLSIKKIENSTKRPM